MPKKPNSSGNDQEYVPAGNGDASGEYADDNGQNRHFAVFAKPLPSNFSTKKATAPVTPKKSKNAKQQNGGTAQDDGSNMTLQEKVDKVLKSDKIKQGTERLVDYKRNSKKYEYGIEQAMAEQGFDGLPQVVEADVFDEIVKQSNFVAQRGVGAYSKAQLDSYTNDLYNGKWYVSCDSGGAQYGQGMYCAADYTGNISSGVRAEATQYAQWHSSGGNYRVETLTLTPDAKIVEHADLIKDLKAKMDSDDKIYEGVHNAMVKHLLLDSYARGMSVDTTLDELQTKYPDLVDYANHQVEFALTGDVTRHKKLDKSRTLNLSTKEQVLKNSIDWNIKEFKKAINGATNGKVNDSSVSYVCTDVLGMNDGELAVLLGYDAINAKNHGMSGSYTVILNRTKTIFKKQ